MLTNNSIRQNTWRCTFSSSIWLSGGSGVSKIGSNKLLLIGPGTRQHGMQCPSGPDCVAPCNLGHASVPAAAAGEMSSAAAFNPPHKFCCVLVQFYGAGAGLFKTLHSWSLSAAGPDTFLCASACVRACVCASGLIISLNPLLMKTLLVLCRPCTPRSCTRPAVLNRCRKRCVTAVAFIVV